MHGISDQKDQFVIAAERVGEAIGIETKPVDTEFADVISPSLMLESVDGRHWIEVRMRHRLRSNNQLSTSRSTAAYCLRGLLTDAEGMFDVDNHLFRAGVQVLSSPADVNDAQLALGQTPGVDAFRLQPTSTPPGQSSRSQLRAGQFVDGACELILPVANRQNDFMAVHDLNTPGHLFSWFCMHPDDAVVIQARAQDLKRIHGDAIHAPAAERPKIVEQFAAGLDGWSSMVRLSFRAIQNIEYRSKISATEPSPVVNLQRFINLQPVHETATAESVQRAHRVLQDKLNVLGLIPAGLKAHERIDAQREVYRRTAAHIAELFLRLEEVAPLEGDNPRAQAARMALRAGIRDRFQSAA